MSPVLSVHPFLLEDHQRSDYRIFHKHHHVDPGIHDPLYDDPRHRRTEDQVYVSMMT